MVVGALCLGCAGARPAASPLAAPPFEQPATLVSVNAKVGVSEAALETWVRAHLGTLSQCIGFSHVVEATIIPIRDFEAEDDRVEVVLESERDEENQRSVRVAGVRSGLSDEGCVAQQVERWPCPPALLEALARGGSAPARFIYRFRPDAARREARRAQNKAALAKVCEAFAHVDPKKDPILPYWSAIAESVSPDVKRILGGTAKALTHVHPVDTANIFAASYGETEQMLGVPPGCPALRAWLTW